MKDCLARWCGCHVVLSLSYLQKDKGKLLYVDVYRYISIADFTLLYSRLSVLYDPSLPLDSLNAS